MELAKIWIRTGRNRGLGNVNKDNQLQLAHNVYHFHEIYSCSFLFRTFSIQSIISAPGNKLTVSETFIASYRHGKYFSIKQVAPSETSKAKVFSWKVIRLHINLKKKETKLFTKGQKYKLKSDVSYILW